MVLGAEPEKKDAAIQEQTIREKIVFYAPLDGNLFARGIKGREYEAEFKRGSLAFDPDDAKEYQENEPIFKEGKFGKGIYLVHGAFHQHIFNLLSPNQSDIEEGIEGFVAAEGVNISRQAGGWHGKHSLAVNIANKGKGFYTTGVKGTTVEPVGGTSHGIYNASLYLKGDKAGEKLKLWIEDKTNAQVSEPVSVTLEKHWKKFYTGDVARLKDLTTDDLRLHVASESETPIKLNADGLELAWAKHYSYYSAGTDWMPGGEGRAHDALLFSSIEGCSMKEGAVSTWHKPTHKPNSGLILSIPNFPFHLGHSIIHLRGVNAYPGSPTIGEYSFVAFSWDEKGGVYYINGEVKAQTAAPYNKEKDDLSPFSIGFCVHEWGVPNGVIDELTLYKSPLTAEEVKFLRELKKPLKPLP